jgi:hypothetical protein
MNEEGREYTIGDFLMQYREPIGKLIESFSKGVEESPKLKFRAMVGFFTILMVIFGILSYLTFLGKVSSEALVFLAGSIVGYSFAFLHKYIIGVT